MNYTLQLGPGESKPINAQGNFFAIVLAPSDVMVRTPGSEEVLYAQGDSYTLPPGEDFRRLEVRNPTASDAVVVVYAGTGRYEQRRQAVVEPRTVVQGHAGAVLAAGASVTLPGAISGRLIRRKAVTVSNEDPNLNLELQDAAGVPFATVFAGFPTIYPISEPVILKNNNPTPVSYKAGEIFWTT